MMVFMMKETEKNIINNDVKCVMLDLDGTVYLGSRLFDFTVDFLNRLDHIGIGHIFLTNNSSLSANDYLEKFRRLGIQTTIDNILTSGNAAADYINSGEYKGKRVFVMGTKSLKKELYEHGINVCDDNPDLLLAGFDTELTFDTLTKFTNYVADGCHYIATHPDNVCPNENGFWPDLGSFIQLIYACTGRYPEKICGKPSEQILVAAEHKTGLKRQNLLMVGDRLSTDIAIGKHGVPTALVLSGESKIDDIPKADVKPTYVFDSIRELGFALEKKSM